MQSMQRWLKQGVANQTSQDSGIKNVAPPCCSNTHTQTHNIVYLCIPPLFGVLGAEYHKCAL